MNTTRQIVRHMCWRWHSQPAVLARQRICWLLARSQTACFSSAALAASIFWRAGRAGGGGREARPEPERHPYRPARHPRGPDRRVLQEVTIPDDGKPRGSGWACATLPAVGPGGTQGRVCAELTVSQDRYGEHAIWGFRSNCRSISSRRPAPQGCAHESRCAGEPGPARRRCVPAARGAFNIELSGLPKGAAAPQLFDASGVSIATLPVSTNDAAAQEFAARSTARPCRGGCIFHRHRRRSTSTA